MPGRQLHPLGVALRVLLTQSPDPPLCSASHISSCSAGRFPPSCSFPHPQPSMASPVLHKLEDKLLCSICLELFRVPVTLPCGHNFCERCINDHRSKQEQTADGAERGYKCPQCRSSCERQLELKKNVTLSEVVEVARASRVWAESCEVAHVGLCPQHGRPLELYCEDEQRCICCVCSVRQCQRHRRALFGDERSRKQVGNAGRGDGGGAMPAGRGGGSAC